MAALFEPFPLWLAAWETPTLEGIPLVSLSKGRVVHVSKTARQRGVATGSSFATALTRAPDLEVVEAASPYLTASWERLVDVTVFLTDLERDFQTYNRIYTEYFGSVRPCRTTIGVARLPGPIAIEP